MSNVCDWIFCLWERPSRLDRQNMVPLFKIFVRRCHSHLHNGVCSSTRSSAMPHLAQSCNCATRNSSWQPLLPNWEWTNTAPTRWEKESPSLPQTTLFSLTIIGRAIILVFTLGSYHRRWSSTQSGWRYIPSQSQPLLGLSVSNWSKPFRLIWSRMV